VAAHGAANAMRLGQATAALVGGVNLTLSSDTPAMFTRAGKDGQLVLQISNMLCTCMGIVL
jgi:acyl transferase domain-containing protein